MGDTAVVGDVVARHRAALLLWDRACFDGPYLECACARKAGPHGQRYGVLQVFSLWQGIAWFQGGR
jgi:hypothetical protein